MCRRNIESDVIYCKHNQDSSMIPVRITLNCKLKEMKMKKNKLCVNKFRNFERLQFSMKNTFVRDHKIRRSNIQWQPNQIKMMTIPILNINSCIKRFCEPEIMGIHFESPHGLA